MTRRRAAVEATMRRSLRERPAAAARTRRRERRGRAAAPKESSRETPGEWSDPCDEALLDELLSVPDAATWWKEDERPEDPSLADLLQQLVAADEHIGAQHGALSELRPNCLEEASPSLTSLGATDALHQMATRGRGAGNKNAVAARLNRMRKKEYVSGLECKVARLSDENARLEHERRALGVRVRELESEARYLRAVLANDSALSQLLSRLTGLGGVKLSTSLFRDHPKKPDDHDYALPGLVCAGDLAEEDSAAAPSGGVCLHVDKEKVSVEFCPACARSAASSAKIFSFR
ncbi:CREB/ATF bZIP transcription factor [Bufo bufo]|uniref:CREB/ATF bZIP transcription factor n=1 Tax=Bufo bufo TaxID=8384 RepID=UPI001ABEAEA3|nr:CREB/ATF bZIP transcription factor [Bufo bufo]